MQTLTFLGNLQEIFIDEHMKCWSDIVQHMMEELGYIHDYVIAQRFNKQRELEYLLQEHVENLEFIHCNDKNIQKEKIATLTRDLKECQNQGTSKNFVIQKSLDYVLFLKDLKTAKIPIVCDPLNQTKKSLKLT